MTLYPKHTRCWVKVAFLKGTEVQVTLMMNLTQTSAELAMTLAEFGRRTMS